MPTNIADTRYIHFVREGCDIRTAEGVTLKDRGTPCTLSLSHLRLMLRDCGGLLDALLELWARDTELDLDQDYDHPDVDLDDEAKSAADPPKAFQPHGRPNQALHIKGGTRTRGNTNKSI
ncbi:hypothetical protein PMZ80_004009 [Knufia obscura]|uniref:Uncharacterized protein n=2 Tax=Knufia TaxID=430999 RepID=A0AAN8I4X3_9EURO|nr:hypothetical protein PMZ80_004009 [Knufia obscura]KAK5952264.1 hypothetical protein OHC33_006737 [Knufia fluminis]